MNVPLWLWAATVVGFIAILVVDLVVVDSRPHVFTTKEATRWVLVYVLLAVLFGAFLWVKFGAAYGQQFYSGWITEYSLSVDNLFVFLVIMSSFSVPEENRHRVLLVGVVIALVLRAILIAVGAAAIERFAATFYLFGAFLLWTAWSVGRSNHDDEPDPDGNALIRRVEKMIPTTREYHGTSLTVRIDGIRHATPMLLVMLAIGTTDLLFALDSIPAVFGLTREPYIVLTANAFALMGLRQLYFLLGGLLSKLIYLGQGLAIILAFIGVKMIFEAMHATTEIHVPHIGIETSLGVIVLTLAATAVLSLYKVRGNPELAKHSPAAEAQEDATEVAGEALEHLPDEE
jgi:tellurite resistance protein TerC